MIALFDRGQRVDAYAYNNGPAVAYAIEDGFGWVVVYLDAKRGNRVKETKRVDGKKAAIEALGLLGEGTVIWHRRPQTPAGRDRLYRRAGRSDLHATGGV